MELLKTLELIRVWERIIEGWQIKMLFALVFHSLFGDYNAGMGALAILVLVDLITKMWTLSKEAGSFGIAWHTGAISSRGIREGIPKIFWYMMLLIAANQLSHFSMLNYVVGEAPKEIISAYLALIEIKSILENLRSTGMGGLEPLIGMLGKRQKQITGDKDE